MLWPRMLASLAAAELAARHQGTSPPFTVSFRAFEGDMAEVTTVKRQWSFFFFSRLCGTIFSFYCTTIETIFSITFLVSTFLEDLSSCFLTTCAVRVTMVEPYALQLALLHDQRRGHPRRLLISRWYWTCNLSNICRLVLMSVTCFTYHFEEFGVFLCESVASRTILKSSMCCQANVRTSDVFSDALGFSHVSPQRHHFALKGASFECY